MATEVYVRVWVKEGEDPADVQGRLDAIDRNIGSSLVDHGEDTPQDHRPDLLIGFNGTDQEIRDSLNAARRTQGVRNVRPQQNRASRPHVQLPPPGSP